MYGSIAIRDMSTPSRPWEQKLHHIISPRSLCAMFLVTPLTVAAILCSVATAINVFPPDPLADAPDACLQALNTTYTCDNKIRHLDRQNFYDRSDLDIVCTTACRAALIARRQPIADACGSYTYQDSNGLYYPPVVLVDQTSSTFDTVCRKSR